MTDESEIWSAATLLAEQVGRDATRVAEARMDQLERRGDHAGAATWRRIRTAIEHLTSSRSAR